MRLFVRASCLLIALHTLALADAPASQPADDKTMNDLVRLLGNDNFKVREDATAKLAAMGPAIFLQLQAKLQDKTLDTETVARLQSTFEQIAPLYHAQQGAKQQDQAAKTLGVTRDLTLDLGDKITLKLNLIPAGKFTMGNPDFEKYKLPDHGPLHEVTISKAFYMAVYTVTQEQYEQLMGNNPSAFKGPQNPVEMVTYTDAEDFCKKLSQKSGKTVRLPTEAEWEYACRAGSTAHFCFGDDENKLGDYAWKAENSRGKTHPVGEKKPNDWGLYDMHGNIWQWCADWFGDYPKEAQTDPTGPAAGKDRIWRGGCWLNRAFSLGSGFRSHYGPDKPTNDTGFRVVVEVK